MTNVVIGLCPKKRREEDAEIVKLALLLYFAANVQYAFAWKATRTVSSNTTQDKQASEGVSKVVSL